MRPARPFSACRLWLLGAVVLGGTLAVVPSRAQAPLYLVNDSTSVRSVNYRYAGTKTLEPAQLNQQIATRAPGFFESGWRKAVFGWLPFFGGGGHYPFSPIELQKDVVRLSRYYRRNGFPRPAVDYLLRLDTTRNAIAVLFTIDEGPPLVIDSLTFAGPGGQPAYRQLAPELQGDWVDFRDRVALLQGERLDDFRLVRLQDQTLGWLRERGYAFADVSAESRVDSAAFQADVRIKMNAGPRARYDEILIEGVESVDPAVVRRELPFREGDAFRQSDLTEGQRQIFGLNLFQLAAVSVVDSLSQRSDSTVAVRVVVSEGPPRVLSGFAGYTSAGGATASAQWTHRNFFGDARTFTASLRAQTGVGVVGQYPEVDYEGRLSLRQPYLFDRRLSGAIEPFARYRDDVVERATTYGASGTLLYEQAALRTASLSLTYTDRTVGSDSVSLVDPSTLLPGSAFSITRSQLRLGATLGRLDDPLNPRAGFVVRPSATLAGLAFSDVSFATGNLSASVFVPFGRARRVGLVARVSGGLLQPFGGTDPALAHDYLALRDVLYFAGGTNDVRGWNGNLLGPKFIDFTTVTDTSFAAFAEEDDPIGRYYTVKYGVRYRPVGAQAKVSGSLQLNLPLPLGPQWGASAFVDAGRVFGPAEGLYALYGNAVDDFPNLAPLIQRFREDTPAFRVGTGAGIQYLTPVGYLSFAVGVKLTPSFFDLRDPREVFRAADIEDLEPGAPDIDAVGAGWSQRLAFHLNIGQTF